MLSVNELIAVRSLCTKHLDGRLYTLRAWHFPTLMDNSEEGHVTAERPHEWRKSCLCACSCWQSLQWSLLHSDCDLLACIAQSTKNGSVFTMLAAESQSSAVPTEECDQLYHDSALLSSC